MPHFLNTRDDDFEERFQALLTSKREDAPDVDAVVAEIIADVRDRGDAAVIELTRRFDRLELTPETLAFSPDEIAAECAKVPAEERAALELAADRIRAYHSRQMPENALWQEPNGAELGWRWTAVGAAGLYVPGGLASYPSSVLMNAIPAQVAGVSDLVITSVWTLGLTLLALTLCFRPRGLAALAVPIPSTTGAPSSPSLAPDPAHPPDPGNP